MRIIFSNYDDLNNPYYGGGGARAVHEVAKRLVKKYQVTVITGNYPGSVNKIVDGVQYKRIGNSTFGPKLNQLFFQFLLPFQVHKENFDIWIESFTPPFSTGFLPLFTKKPVIGLVHSLSGEEMKDKYKLPFDKIEKFGIRYYPKIIVNSSVIKNKIRDVDKNTKIIVIPNGIEDKILKTSKKHSDKHLLYLGRIDVFQKGLDILIEALINLSDRTKPTMYIVGGGNEKNIKELRTLIKGSRLKNIKYLGRKDGKEKESLYKNAAIFILPSRFENYPLTILEAFAYRCPVIVSDLDNLKWIPRNYVRKFIPASSEQLAKQIKSLLDRKETREHLVEKGLSFVQNHGWNKIASQYENVLKES